MGISILQKTGKVEKTVDREFDDCELAYQQHRAKIMSLQKSVRSYLDALRSMTYSQKRIAESFMLLAESNSPVAMAFARYKACLTAMDEELRPVFDSIFLTSNVDSLATFVEHFENIDSLIRKRQHKLLDYDWAEAKTKRAIKKPSANASKLARLEDKSSNRRAIYQSYNTKLIDELPKLFQLIDEYFRPCFEAFLQAQCFLFREMSQSMSGLRAALEPTAVLPSNGRSGLNSSRNASLASSPGNSPTATTAPDVSTAANGASIYGSPVESALNQIKSLSIAM